MIVNPLDAHLLKFTWLEGRLYLTNKKRLSGNKEYAWQCDVTAQDRNSFLCTSMSSALKWEWWLHCEQSWVHLHSHIRVSAASSCSVCSFKVEEARRLGNSFSRSVSSHQVLALVHSRHGHLKKAARRDVLVEKILRVVNISTYPQFCHKSPNHRKTLGIRMGCSW